MEELVELVTLALLGDQTAAEQINQIQSAAEAGDEEAVAILDLIQSIVEELQSGSSPQVAAAKCGAKLKKRKGTGKVKAKKAAMGTKIKGCGCGKKLYKVGGKLVEGDCNGRPVPKALLGWGINNLVRVVGDGIGTLAGKVHEYGQKAVGAGQLMIGGAAQAVTNGLRGAGWVLAGADKRATARAVGARTNRVIDEASAHAGNMANAGIVAGLTIINPAWGIAAGASDIAAGKLIGNYNPVTGGRTTDFLPNPDNTEPDRTTLTTTTPSAVRLGSVAIGKTSTTPNVIPGTASNQPPKLAEEINPKEETLEALTTAKKTALKTELPASASALNDVTGKYSKYGIAYKQGEEGPVEDWENSNVTSQEVARQIRSNNRQAGFDERAARRAAVPVGMRNHAYYQAQRDSRRKQYQANREVRKWDKSQRDANAAALMDKVQGATYELNGGTINYSRWFS